MKRINPLALLLLIGAMSTPIWAATKTVTLDVPGMTCETCPITVKKALNRVSGVANVAVNFDKKQAVVTFDDARTNTKELVKATTDAGYPSTPEQAAK
jgi:periplasmic mercuric ion binding protein